MKDLRISNFEVYSLFLDKSNFDFFLGFQSKGNNFLKMSKNYWNLENIITASFQ